MADRSYRWGKFQAWGALVFAVAQFVLVRFPVSLFVGVFFLYLWTGLLHKRRYGFVLMHIATIVAILAGSFHLAIDTTWDVFIQLLIACCFWGIPAAFYYPKRYYEFGFGKTAASVPAREPVKPPASEMVQAAGAASGGEMRRVGYEEWREAIARARVQKMIEERDKEKRT